MRAANAGASFRAALSARPARSLPTPRPSSWVKIRTRVRAPRGGAPVAEVVEVGAAVDRGDEVLRLLGPPQARRLLVLGDAERPAGGHPRVLDRAGEHGADADRPFGVLLDPLDPGAERRVVDAGGEEGEH